MVVLSRQLLADESKSGPSCTYPVPKIMLYYRDHQGPWLILVMVHPNPVGFPVFLTSWVRVVLGLSKWFPKKAGSKCVKARRNAKKEQQKSPVGQTSGYGKSKTNSETWVNTCPNIPRGCDMSSWKYGKLAQI